MNQKDCISALESERLLTDPVLNLALNDMRKGALEALVQVDAFNTNAVLSAQNRVAAIDAFKKQLQRFVLAGQESKKRLVP